MEGGEGWQVQQGGQVGLAAPCGSTGDCPTRRTPLCTNAAARVLLPQGWPVAASTGRERRGP
eukprot:5548060-Alexandrium_andersonii.AAC.1